MSITEEPGEQQRMDLYAAGVEAFPHIPDLAGRWLAELCEDDGLPSPTDIILSIGGRQVSRQVSTNPANLSPDLQVEHAVLDNGQTLWLRRAKRRFLNGYRGVTVVDRPGRTMQATLAALTNLEGRKVDQEQLTKSLLFLNPADAGSISDSLFARSKELRRGGNIAGARDLLALERPLHYAHALLQYYRPDFEALSKQEQRDLLEGCCERMNKLLDCTRRLTEFLEYGAPSRDQRPAVENAPRDVEAAVLREVDGLKYREIAKKLGVEISTNSQAVGDYSTVSKMVQRGRNILERAYGHDGWDELAENMRQELSEWKSLTAEEQMQEFPPGISLQTP